jgi:hypothetical protein
MPRSRAAFLALLLGPLTGCESSEGAPEDVPDVAPARDAPEDAALDVSQALDVPQDTTQDVSQDVSQDVPLDASPDTSLDARPDVTRDVPMDTVDAPAEVSVDAPMDARPDATADAPRPDAGPSPPTWSAAEVVRDYATGGLYFPSVGLDGAGRPRVAWEFRGPVDTVSLVSSRLAPGMWSAESDPEGVPNADSGPSMIVESDGTLHVAYLDEAARLMRYARGGGDPLTWAIRREGVYAGIYHTVPALALDPSRTLHVIHQFGISSQLAHLTRSPAGSFGPPAGVGPAGSRSPSLAVDPTGALHLSYFESSTRTLRYGFRAAGATTFTLASAAPAEDGATGASSIAVRDGVVHIAYQATATGGDGVLKYARRDVTGRWTQELVYGVGNTGAAPSIGVTSSSHVVIASLRVASPGLHFATNESGRWVTTQLDTSGTEGSARSLAVGADDSVHVVYFDAAGVRVLYRVRR